MMWHTSGDINLYVFAFGKNFKTHSLLENILLFMCWVRSKVLPPLGTMRILKIFLNVPQNFKVTCRHVV